MYAGVDPVTGKRIELYGTADSESEAKKLRTKLLAQADSGRVAKRRVTVE